MVNPGVTCPGDSGICCELQAARSEAGLGVNRRRVLELAFYILEHMHPSLKKWGPGEHEIKEEFKACCSGELWCPWCTGMHLGRREDGKAETARSTVGTTMTCRSPSGLWANLYPGHHDDLQVTLSAVG